MATVPGEPYEPFSTVAPAERVLRPGGVAPVPDAFGAGLARAVAVFGGDVERTGAQVFDTALQARKLQVETGVRDAVTDHYTKSAPVQADFLSAQGTNASNEALTGHLNQINSMRVAARADVEKKFGAYGASLFDSDTSAIQRNFVVQATQHSAREMKTAANKSIDARIDSIGDAIQSAPDNSEANDQAISDIKKLEAQRGALHGFTRDVVEDNTNKEISKLTAKRIIGTAIRGDDKAALEMLEQARQDKTLRGDVADAVQQKIQAQAQRNFSYFKQVETYDRQNEERNTKADIGKIMSNNVTFDEDTGQFHINPKVNLELGQLQQKHPLAYKLIEDQLKFVQHQQELAAKGVKVRDDPETVSGLNRNMFSETRPTSLQDLAAASGNDQISPETMRRLEKTVRLRDAGNREAFNDPLFKNAESYARTVVEGTSAIQKKVNAARYGAFQFALMQEYLRRVREHTLEPDDLDVGKKDSLINRMVNQYRRPMGETVRANGGVGAPPPAPPETGQPTSLPPVKERVKGNSYMTGMGLMEWTGTGWVKPKPEARM